MPLITVHGDGIPWAVQGDIPSSQTVRSSESMQGWLTMLFGIAADGLSEHMPCLCKRLFIQREREQMRQASQTTHFSLQVVRLREVMRS